MGTANGGNQEGIHSRKIAATLLGSGKQFGLTEVEQREIGGHRIDFLPKATIFKEGEPKAAVYKLSKAWQFVTG